METMRTALVTGGGSGIGRETAIAFARAGAQVVVADVAVAAGEETAHAIETSGGRAIFLRTDVSRSDEVEKMVATTVSTFGSLDHAFNNAGIAPRGAPIAELSEEHWDRTITVNLPEA